VLWIVIALLLVFLFNLFQGTSQHANASAINYTKFRQEVLQGDVKSVTMQGDTLKGELSNGQSFRAATIASSP
jgi:cell division protease FtsH